MDTDVAPAVGSVGVFGGAERNHEVAVLARGTARAEIAVRLLLRVTSGCQRRILIFPRLTGASVGADDEDGGDEGEEGGLGGEHGECKWWGCMRR